MVNQRSRARLQSVGHGSSSVPNASAPASPVLVALGDLHPAPWNPRLVRDRRFKALCASLRADPDFLWRRPVLATADGTIYAGNMRYRAAQHLGWTHIPAVVEDVTDQRARERALRDNTQSGEWQEDELAQLLYELDQQGSDLSSLAVDDAEIKRLLASVGIGDGDGEGEGEGEGEGKAAPTATPAGAGAEYHERYELVIACRDEAELQALYERLTGEGLRCRALKL